MKWSSRWPAASGGTAMARGSGMRWPLHIRRCVLRLHCGSGLGYGDAPRFALEQEERSDEHGDDPGRLRGLQKSAKHCAAADGIAPELGNKKDDAGGHQEDAREIAVLPAARQQKQQKKS